MSREILLIATSVVGLLLTGCVVLAVQSWFGFFRRKREEREEQLYAEPQTESPSFLDRPGVRAVLMPLARRFRPSDEGELSGLRLKLARAGMSSRAAVDRFALVQVSALLVAAALAVPWLLMSDIGLTLMGLASCVAVGLLFPRLWLSLRTSTRRERISGALASTLDLLVVCMEAGLGLEQALSRVAQELDRSEPEMAEEFAITLHELQAGIPTNQAFRKLADRVDLEEMHMLCGVIIQSSSMGASIGNVLRQYAASWRTQRMLELEERAGKMTAGLTLPLTICLLPASVLAMLGPAVIIVMRNLG